MVLQIVEVTAAILAQQRLREAAHMGHFQRLRWEKSTLGGFSLFAKSKSGFQRRRISTTQN
jgi:hypothetical protein